MNRTINSIESHRSTTPHESSRLPALLSSCSILLALASVACGSSDNEPEADTGSGPPVVTFDPVGSIVEGPTTCTESNTICASMEIPEGLEGTPDSILFLIYDSPQQPSHPPNGYAGIFPTPEVAAGERMYVELTDGGQEGDYWMFGIMYMPGGGLNYVPVVDVDYVMGSPPPPITLDGSPVTLDAPIVLRKLTGGM